MFIILSKVFCIIFLPFITEFATFAPQVQWLNWGSLYQKRYIGFRSYKKLSNYEFNSLTLPSLHFVRGQAQEHQTGNRARWQDGKGAKRKEGKCHSAVLPFR